MATPRRGDTSRRSDRRRGTRWSGEVGTQSTYPPPKTFSGSADEIARTMASKRVSPKGLGSAIRMIQFFINRAGKNLPPSRRRELERAKRILQDKRVRRTSRPRSGRDLGGPELAEGGEAER